MRVKLTSPKHCLAALALAVSLPGSGFCYASTAGVETSEENQEYSLLTNPAEKPAARPHSVLGLQARRGHSTAIRAGIHLNPILNMPGKGTKSTYNEEFYEAKKGGLGVSYGANVRLEVNRIIMIETGINRVHKTYEFTQKKFTAGSSGSYTINAKVVAREFPFLLGFNIIPGSKSNSLLTPLIGFSVNSYKIAEVTESKNLSNVSVSGTIGGSGPNSTVITRDSYSSQSFIAGVKILHPIKKMGSIEYGLTYHIELSDAPEINIKSAGVQPGTYGPTLNYLRLNLIYYPLNLVKMSRSGGFKREKVK